MRREGGGHLTFLLGARAVSGSDGRASARRAPSSRHRRRRRRRRHQYWLPGFASPPSAPPTRSPAANSAASPAAPKAGAPYFFGQCICAAPLPPPRLPASRLENDGPRPARPRALRVSFRRRFRRPRADAPQERSWSPPSALSGRTPFGCALVALRPRRLSPSRSFRRRLALRRRLAPGSAGPRRLLLRPPSKTSTSGSGLGVAAGGTTAPTAALGRRPRSTLARCRRRRVTSPTGSAWSVGERTASTVRVFHSPLLPSGCGGARTAAGRNLRLIELPQPASEKDGAAPPPSARASIHPRRRRRGGAPLGRSRRQRTRPFVWPRFLVERRGTERQPRRMAASRPSPLPRQHRASAP